MESISKFIEKKLDLKVNIEKSRVARPNEIKYLGFGFFQRNNKWKPKPHLKSVQNIEQNLIQLTQRNRSISISELMKILNPILRGWINYYRICCMKVVISTIAKHLRRRIRQIIWKQWKNCKTRFKNLQKLGVHEMTARANAWTRKGYWRMSNTPVINKALSNKRLEMRGLIQIEEYFRKVHEPYFLIYDID